MIPKDFVAKMVELSVFMSFLMFAAAKSVGSAVLVPYQWRSYLVMAIYCLAFFIFCYFRLKPIKKTEMFKNVLVITLAQAIAYLALLSFNGGLHDMAGAGELLGNLTMVLFFTAVVSAVVQLILMLFCRKKLGT